MKAALVIGARSMLGAQLCTMLRETGVEVITAGRSAGDDILLDLEGKFEPICINELKVDVAFHIAASFGQDTSEGIALNYEVNASSSWKVAKLCRSLKVDRLIYAGTVSSSFAQTDRVNFNSYGLSKLLAEHVLGWSLSQNDMGFTSLRLPQLYDIEGRCCIHQPWFGRVIAYAARGKDLRLPRSLGPRNFLHVRDAASLMICAAERAIDGVLDIVHPEFVDCDRLAEIAYTVFGKGGKVLPAPEKAPFRKVCFPEADRSFELLGQHPRIDMHTGLTMIKEANTWSSFGPLDVI